MVAVLVLLVATGGLISSLINRRHLRELGVKLDHNTKNQKLVKQALDYQIIKEAGERSVVAQELRRQNDLARNVVIVNPATDPAQVEVTNGSLAGHDDK